MQQPCGYLSVLALVACKGVALAIAVTSMASKKMSSLWMLAEFVASVQA